MGGWRDRNKMNETIKDTIKMLKRTIKDIIKMLKRKREKNRNNKLIRKTERKKGERFEWGKKDFYNMNTRYPREYYRIMQNGG